MKNSIVVKQKSDFLLRGATIISLLFSLLVSEAMAGNGTFHKTYMNGPGASTARALWVLDDGRILLGGNESNDGTGNDHLLLELSPMGQILSQVSFGSTNGDVLDGIIDYDNGKVTAIGNVTDIHGAGDLAVFQYDYNTDSLLWTNVIGGSTYENYRDGGKTANGDFIVMVSSYSFPSGNWNPLIIKLDDSGNVIWKKKIHGSSIDRSYGMTVTSDEGCAVTGFTMSSSAYVEDMFLAKLDSAGALEWSRNYDFSAYDEGKDVLQTADGGYLITGNISRTDTSFSPHSSADIVLIKTDSVGNVEWNKAYSRANRDKPERMIRRANGNYVIAGYTENGSGGSEDGFAIEVDSTGNIEWGRMYGGSGLEYFFDVKEAPGGDLLFCGYSESFNTSGNRELYLVRTDNSGVSGCNDYSWSSSNDFELWQGNSSFSIATAGNEDTFSGHHTPNMVDSVMCDSCSVITASFTTNNDTLYLSDTIQFTNTSTGASNYTWLINGHIVSDTENYEYYFRATGNYDFQLIAHNGFFECADTTNILSHIITTKPYPIYQDQRPFSLNAPVDVDSTGDLQVPPMKFHDRFGNEYDLDDLRIPSQTMDAGIFRLHFWDQDNSTGIGFDDPSPSVNPSNCIPPCDSLGEERRWLVARVYEDLSRLLCPGGDPQNLPEPYPNAPVQRVEVDVRSNVEPSGDTLAASTLGSASSIYFGEGDGLLYGEVWKVINTGWDSYFNLANTPFYNNVPAFHGLMTIKFDSTVDWYTDITENTTMGGSQRDLYKVTLHEALHMLGFASFIQENGEGFQGADLYSLYDTYLRFNTSGNPVLVTDSNFCYDATLNIPVGDITPGCTNLYFEGTGTANSFQAIQATSTWQPGSSLSHFNCISSGCPNNGYVMNYCAGSGSASALRNLHDAEVQTLCDLGYNIQGVYGFPAVAGVRNGDTEHTYTGACPINNPTEIAGVNDFGDTDNTGAVTTFYEVEAGQSICFAAGGGNNNILVNDNNADEVHCVEILYPTGGQLTNVSVNGFCYEPPGNYAGNALIKYRPYNSTNEQWGNTTYIFVEVTTPPVPPCENQNDCNLVCHGDFEELIHQFAFPLNRIMFNNAGNTPDLYVQGTGASITLCQRINPHPTPHPDGGDNYVGLTLFGGREALRFQLIKNLEPNTTYILSFIGQRMGIGCQGATFGLQAMFSSNPPCTPIDLSCFPAGCSANCNGYTFEPVTFPNLNFNVNANNWTTYQAQFTVPNGLDSLDNLILYRTGTSATYLYIDNVEIIETNSTEINIIPTVTNSTPCAGGITEIEYEICLSDSSADSTNLNPIDLELELPTAIGILGGDFDGNGDFTIPQGALSDSCNYVLTVQLETDPGIFTGFPYDVFLNVVSGGCVPDTLSNSVTITPSESDFDIDVGAFENTSCNGNGIAFVVTSDGTPPYLYEWSNGETTDSIFNLFAGNYAVTVTDSAGCSLTDTAEVEGIFELNVNIGFDNNCAGTGDATAIVTGGAAPFTYLWSNNDTTQIITDIQSGVYSVTVTDSMNCTASATDTIDSGPLSLSAQVTNSCPNDSTGAIDLTVSSGTPGYTFIWSNGETTEDIIDLAMDSFAVTVTDAMGCDTTLSAFVDTFTADYLTLEKSASPNTDLNPGDTVTYTLELCNTSMSETVENIDLSDFLPTELNFVSASAELGYNANFHEIGLTQTMNLEADSCVLLTYVVTLDSSMTCAFSPLQNCATVTDADGICIFPQACDTLSGSDIEITGNTIICRGTVVDYSTFCMGDVTYNWQAVGGQIQQSSGNTVNVLWSNAGGGEVIVTVLDASSTPLTSDTLDVAVFSPPSPTIVSDFKGACKKPIPTDALDPDEEFAQDSCWVVCDSSTVVYTAPQSPGSSYQWIVHGASSHNSNGNELTVTWNEVGSGLVKVIETDPNACYGEAVICINVIKSPEADFSIMSEEITGGSACKNQNVYFLDNSGEEYIFWDFGDGTVSTQRDPVHQFNTAGVYEVLQIVENSCGCRDTSAFKIEIDADIAPDITCISTVCENDTAIYTTSANCGSYDWSVSGSGTIISGQGTAAVEVVWGNSTNGYGIIILDAECTGYCSHPTSEIVPLINDDAIITGKNPACNNEVTSYSIPYTPGAAFTWSITGGQIINSTTPPSYNKNKVYVEWGTGSSGQLIVEYDNNVLGCTYSDTLNVSLKDTFTLNGNSEGCLGEEITFETTNSPSTSYDWEVIDQTNTTVAGPVSSGASFNHIFNTEGLYEVVAKHTGSSYCNEERSIFVEIFSDVPTPDTIVGPVEICPNRAYEYSASPESNDYFLQWEITGGTPASYGGSIVNIIWDASGPYAIDLFQVSKNPPYCSSDTFHLDVDQLSISSLPIEGLDTVCMNSRSVYSTDIEADRYEWILEPGRFGSIISDNTQQNIEVEWHNDLSPPSAELTLRAWVCGSIISDDMEIFVRPAPQAELSIPDTVCPGSFQIFSELTNHPSAVEWKWDFGDGNSTTTTSSSTSYSYSSEGNYTIRVTAIYNSTGCIDSSSDASTIYVYPQPVGNISQDSAYCTSDAVTFYASIHNGSTSDYNFTWLRNSVQVQTGATTYMPTQDGSYVVEIENKNTGCTSLSNEIGLGCGGGGGPGGNCGASFTHTAEFNATPQSTCGAIEFTAVFSGSGNPQVKSWDFGDGNTSTSSTPTHTYDHSGVYNVTMYYEVDDSLGSGKCSHDIDSTVIVYLIADFKTEYTCSGSNSIQVQLHDHSDYVIDPITSWDWEEGGNNIGSGSDPIVSLPSGQHNVTLEVQSASATCEVTLGVDVPQAATAGFTFSTPICEGVPVAFTDQSSGIVNRYEWDFDDNAGSNLQDPNHSYTSNFIGLNVPSLIITDSYGCTDTTSNGLSVNGNNVSGQINPSDPPPFCKNDSVELTIQVFNGQAPFDYTWSSGEGNASIFSSETGVYTVTVEDDLGCFDVFGPTTTSEISLPEINPVGKTIYCFGEYIELSIYQGSEYDYTWYDASGIVSSSAELNIPVPASAAGSSIDFVAEIASDTCSVQDTISVEVFGNPSVNILESPAGACAGDLSLTASSAEAVYYFWNNGQTTASIDADYAGLYQVEVVDSNGCTADTTVEVSGRPDFGNLMTGCYSFCDDELPVVIPGLGSDYDHEWISIANPNVTTDTLLLDESGFYEYYLVASSSSGCTDTSGLIQVSILDCDINCYNGLLVVDTPSITCVGQNADGFDLYFVEWVVVNNSSQSFRVQPTLEDIYSLESYFENLSHNSVPHGSHKVSAFLNHNDDPSQCFYLNFYRDGEAEAPCCQVFYCVELSDCQREECNENLEIIDELSLPSFLCLNDVLGGTLYGFKQEVFSNAGNNVHYQLSSDGGIISDYTPNNQLVPGANIIYGAFIANDPESFNITINVYDPVADEHCFEVGGQPDLNECNEPEDCELSILDMDIICTGSQPGDPIYDIDLVINNNVFAGYLTLVQEQHNTDATFEHIDSIYLPLGQHTINLKGMELSGEDCMVLYLHNPNTSDKCREEICFEGEPECCEPTQQEISKRSDIERALEKLETQNELPLRIVPNPAANSFIIETGSVDGETAQLFISNLYGKVLKNIDAHDGQSIQIDASEWSPGIYLISKYENGKLQVAEKLVLLPR